MKRETSNQDARGEDLHLIEEWSCKLDTTGFITESEQKILESIQDTLKW